MKTNNRGRIIHSSIAKAEGVDVVLNKTILKRIKTSVKTFLRSPVTITMTSLIVLVCVIAKVTNFDQWLMAGVDEVDYVMAMLMFPKVVAEWFQAIDVTVLVNLTWPLLTAVLLILIVKKMPGPDKD